MRMVGMIWEDDDDEKEDDEKDLLFGLKNFCLTK